MKWYITKYPFGVEYQLPETWELAHINASELACKPYKTAIGGFYCILSKFLLLRTTQTTQYNEMADKSAYMSAGGYSSGYMGSNASSSGYAREDYASGGSGGGASNNQGGSGGTTNPGQQVFKARTDQSCYLGP
ncbi:hypothetical protein B9Z55_006835 [Caenorhabditis nigoni]|nr:hypothetical protein B9Z55_006835 [Caenorhabditis nigoni]